MKEISFFLLRALPYSSVDLYILNFVLARQEKEAKSIV